MQIQLNSSINYKVVILFLINAAICIIKERFISSKYIVLVEILAASAAMYTDINFIYLYPISVFDLVYEEAYIGMGLVLIGVAYFSSFEKVQLLLLIFVMSGLVALVTKNIETKKKVYRNILDSERRLRYELENTKAQLLNSSREVVHIAEVKERNRIARNIHDNIGHSIAGIYMQLQVVEKLYGKDDAKARKLLKDSIIGLSNSLNVVRDTVHNIKPKENLGIEYITKIIDSFKFCEVEFKHIGDFNYCSSSIFSDNNNKYKGESYKCFKVF